VDLERVRRFLLGENFTACSAEGEKGKRRFRKADFPAREKGGLLQPRFKKKGAIAMRGETRKKEKIVMGKRENAIL